MVTKRLSLILLCSAMGAQAMFGRVTRFVRAAEPVVTTHIREASTRVEKRAIRKVGKEVKNTVYNSVAGIMLASEVAAQAQNPTQALVQAVRNLPVKEAVAHWGAQARNAFNRAQLTGVRSYQSAQNAYSRFGTADKRAIGVAVGLGAALVGTGYEAQRQKAEAERKVAEFNESVRFEQATNDSLEVPAPVIVNDEYTHAAENVKPLAEIVAPNYYKVVPSTQKSRVGLALASAWNTTKSATGAVVSGTWNATKSVSCAIAAGAKSAAGLAKAATWDRYSFANVKENTKAIVSSVYNAGQWCQNKFAANRENMAHVTEKVALCGPAIGIIAMSLAK